MFVLGKHPGTQRHTGRNQDPLNGRLRVRMMLKTGADSVLYQQGSVRHSYFRTEAKNAEKNRIGVCVRKALRDTKAYRTESRPIERQAEGPNDAEKGCRLSFVPARVSSKQLLSHGSQKDIEKSHRCLC